MAVDQLLRRHFWAVLLVLSFVTAFVILAAWREVQTLFGV